MCVRVCLFVSVFMVFFHSISEENKLLYMEVSALDATNVNVAFETLFSGKQLRLANFNVMLFVCFVALRPKSTAMVIAGRSVHLTTLFPGQA